MVATRLIEGETSPGRAVQGCATGSRAADSVTAAVAEVDAVVPGAVSVAAAPAAVLLVIVLALAAGVRAQADRSPPVITAPSTERLLTPVGSCVGSRSASPVMTTGSHRYLGIRLVSAAKTFGGRTELCPLWCHRIMSMQNGDGSGLVGATLKVVAIEGGPVLPHPEADLSFDAEGNVGGCATVNRLRGTYALDGDALTFGPLASTLMAGPEDAMAQEQRLFSALSRVSRVESDPETGALVLRDAEGSALVTLEYAVLAL